MPRSTTFFERMHNLGEKDASYFEEKDALYLATDLKRFANYIRRLRSMNPDCSVEDFQKIVLDDYYYNLSPRVLDANHSVENYMDLLSCNYLINDCNSPKNEGAQSKFDEIMERLESGYVPKAIPTSFNDHLESFVYSHIFLNKEFYINSAFNELKPEGQQYILEHQNDSSITPQEKFQRLSSDLQYRKNLSQEDRTRMLRAMRILTFGLRYALPLDKELYQDSIREDLKTSITNIISTLKLTGAYSNYERINKRNFEAMGFPEFCQDPANGKSMYVDLEKEPGILDKLSLDELMTMQSFWINRFNKELKCYSNCLSVIRENNAWAAVLNDDLRQINLSPSNTRLAIEKGQTLFPMINVYITKVQNSVYEGTVEEGTIKESEPIHTSQGELDSDSESDKPSCMIEISYDPLQKIITKGNFHKDYKRYFSAKMPTVENDPGKDIDFYAHLFNPSIIAYMEKSHYISTILASVMSERDDINAGIIPERYKDNEHVDLSRNFIGVGLDTKLTFPVREHLKLSDLKEFVKGYTGDTKVPMYEGEKDFIHPINGKITSAQLVLPFSDEQLDLISRKRVNTADNPALLEHMKFLANHAHVSSTLNNAVYIGGKAPVYSHIRKYVDLDTGKIYIRINDRYEECKRGLHVIKTSKPSISSEILAKRSGLKDDDGVR